jgi:hypothetical protein
VGGLGFCFEADEQRWLLISSDLELLPFNSENDKFTVILFP